MHCRKASFCDKYWTQVGFLGKLLLRWKRHTTNWVWLFDAMAPTGRVKLKSSALTTRPQRRGQKERSCTRMTLPLLARQTSCWTVVLLFGLLTSLSSLPTYVLSFLPETLTKLETQGLTLQEHLEIYALACAIGSSAQEARGNSPEEVQGSWGEEWWSSRWRPFWMVAMPQRTSPHR
jgi:hypothetical protein